MDVSGRSKVPTPSGLFTCRCSLTVVEELVHIGVGMMVKTEHFAKAHLKEWLDGARNRQGQRDESLCGLLGAT